MAAVVTKVHFLKKRGFGGSQLYLTADILLNAWSSGWVSYVCLYYQSDYSSEARGRLAAGRSFASNTANPTRRRTVATIKSAQKPKPVLMVSSTVYGSEELLDRLYAVLEELGFEVWMSHKGTTPVDPMIGALESCQRAVAQCDLFLSIIFPSYGSGKNNPEDDSITHEELRHAIALNKPRWVLVHEHVVVTRNLLRSLGHKTPAERRQLNYRGKVPLDDLRIVDMYEMAMRSDIKEIKDRTGNWVQTAVTDEDVLLFAISQFRRYQEAEAFVKESLGEVAALLKNIKRGKRKS